MKKKIIIFGTGELASIALDSFNLQNQFEIECFTADKKFIKKNSFRNLPVVPFEDIEKNYSARDYQMHVALSYKELNKIREKKYLEAKNKGYTLVSFISKDIYASKNTIFGENCFILENQTIQDGVEIGDNVVIWSSNHIGHGTKIGKSTYISSQVVISGNCKIGDRCFFGVNSAVADFVNIENDCFITMGSNVSSDLKQGSTTIITNSKVLKKEDPLGERLKRKYFKFK